MGADPTAASLHVGNLVALMPLVHFFLNGFPVFTVIGDATAQLGDPSGRSTSRKQMAETTRTANSNSIHNQLKDLSSSILSYAQDCNYPFSQMPSSSQWSIVRNSSWYENLKLLKFLSSVGPHVRVSQMLARDSVTTRLQSPSGLSFAELTYQLLQAYDYSYLYENHSVNLQIGGSDQWGNITAGTDLVRRTHPNANVYALTTPLLTSSSGQKLGKSAGNAIWLDPKLTDSYSLYQYFISAPDDLACKCLDMLTLLPLEQLEQIKAEHEKDPSQRIVHKYLASNVVRMVHGKKALELAQIQTKLLHGAHQAPFGFYSEAPQQGDSFPSLPEIRALFKDCKFYRTIDSSIKDQPFSRLLRTLQIYTSRKEATEHILSGAVSLGHKPILDSNYKFPDNSLFVLRAGKRTFVLDSL